jgi:hypothetical protein
MHYAVSSTITGEGAGVIATTHSSTRTRRSRICGGEADIALQRTRGGSEGGNTSLELNCRNREGDAAVLRKRLATANRRVHLEV